MSTFPGRAMRELTDAGDVRRAIDTRRVMHDRDDDRTTRASALYEQLRVMTNAELTVRHPDPHAAMSMSRAAMIADIVDAEVQPATEDAGNPRKGKGSFDSS